MTKFQCRKMCSLTEQLNLFVWNDQWDFRIKNFCQRCLIQVVFWTAHRDCQCLRRVRQNFLCIGCMRFLWSIFTTFWHIWPLCPLILWLPPPGLAKFLVQTMASWVFLWPIFATFCHSAVQQKMFPGLKICERKSGKNWNNSFC